MFFLDSRFLPIQCVRALRDALVRPGGEVEMGKLAPFAFLLVFTHLLHCKLPGEVLLGLGQWTSLIINTTTIILISGVAVVSQVYHFKTWMSSSHAQSLREHAPELQSWILCIHDVHIWTSHRDQWRFNWYFDKLGVSTRLPESILGSVVSPWHHHRRPGWTQLANSENTYPDLFPLGWSPSLSPWRRYMVTITIPLKTNLAFVSQIIRQKSSCVEKSGPWVVSVEGTSLQTY